MRAHVMQVTPQPERQLTQHLWGRVAPAPRAAHLTAATPCTCFGIMRTFALPLITGREAYRTHGSHTTVAHGVARRGLCRLWSVPRFMHIQDCTAGEWLCVACARVAGSECT